MKWRPELSSTRAVVFPLLTSKQGKPSPARKISDYLEVLTIEGKGFGVVARKDVDAYTLLCSESPVAISRGDQLNRPLEMAFIAQAYRRMAPEIRALFDALHEDLRSF